MEKRLIHQVMPYHRIIHWQRAALKLKGDALSSRVSIVIPVFNQWELTRKCIRSILDHTEENSFKILIVDNHSDDRTEEMLARMVRENEALACIRTLRNYGYGPGCNIGALTWPGEIIVFLNNDTEVAPGWLPPLVSPLEKDCDIGAVGPKLLYKNGSLQCGGVVFNPRSNIPYHIYEDFPGDHRAVNKPRFFAAYTGACLAVRAEDFFELQGFDPIYSNGMEDIDFCLRMGERNKKIFFNPASVIYHLKGQTAGRGERVLQNRRIFVSRWKKRIVPDDHCYYAEDGFSVEAYYRPETCLPDKYARFRAKLVSSASGFQPF